MLIFGGGLLTFELFDAATMRFSPVPNVMLPIPRIGATATALSDGRIMILGGATRADGSEQLDTALIYDPRTHQLSALTSTMRDARSGHSVVALPSCSTR